MSTLLKNGRIITADQDYVADIYIEHEKVTTIGASLNIQADKIIDASGKYVIPGGIDVHTHMDLPFGGTSSSDDFETGTIAAAHGGTTTIVDFAVQSRGTSMRQALETWLKKSEGKACIDYGLHLILTELPDDWLHQPFSVLPVWISRDRRADAKTFRRRLVGLGLYRRLVIEPCQA